MRVKGATTVRSPITVRIDGTGAVRYRLCPLQEAEFQVLRDELDVSDSVLSKHLKQLEEVGYVRFRKSAVNGRQRTWAALTTSGRKALVGHIEELKRIAGVVTS